MHWHPGPPALDAAEQDGREDWDRDIGELAPLIARISERPRRAISPYLIQNEYGQPLNFSLRSRFDKARELAGVSFQFRDLHAKAATEPVTWHTLRNYSPTRIGT